MARAGNIALCAFALLLLAVSLYVHSLTGDYGDKLWELLYARMWLSGSRLYTDIFPVSPPLIFWMYALPVGISEHLRGLSDLQSFFVVGIGVLAFSLFVSLRLIKFQPAFAGNKTKLAEFAALFCFVFIFRTNPHYFLDREHLFLVLVFPYLLRWMPSLSRTPLPLWLRIVTGALAGIGFCIKPQCLVVFAGVQLLYIIRERSLRILVSVENLIIYALGISYLLAVWVLTPEYFSIVVPMALATYSAVSDEASVLSYTANAVSILVLTFLMFRPRATSPYRQDIFYWCGLCPFFLLYALTNNNWAYTYYPLSSTALILTGFVLWEFLYLRQEHKSWPVLAGVCACSIVFISKIALSAVYFWAVIFHGCHDSPACERDEPFMAELRDDHATSFGAITMDFSRWTRVSRYSGAAWETRFPQLWMLPKFLVFDEKFIQDHQWILYYVAGAFAEDLENKKPDVMFVDDTESFYTATQHVDLVAYLSASPPFKEAWKHYNFVHSIDFCSPQNIHKIRCRYDVYRRKP